MINIIDVDMHVHFKEEGINSSFFSSSWFITLFTNALDKNRTDDEQMKVNESLLQLWDYFLCQGWSAISKTGLYMLAVDCENIKSLPFEDVIGAIN
jgi:hypothetical protein